VSNSPVAEENDTRPTFSTCRRRTGCRSGRRARVVEDGEQPTVIAQFDGLDHAFRSLMAWGAHAEVLAPQELRERIAAAAAATAALYAAHL
jgi:predicted DNA-binding transcriptional regulator YafY